MCQLHTGGKNEKHLDLAFPAYKVGYVGTANAFFPPSFNTQGFKIFKYFHSWRELYILERRKTNAKKSFFHVKTHIKIQVGKMAAVTHQKHLAESGSQTK